MRSEITMRFLAGLTGVFGKEMRQALEPSTDVAAMLEGLCDTDRRREALLAEDGSLRRDITILVNGRNIAFLDGLATALDEGDEIHIFPPVHGG